MLLALLTVMAGAQTISPCITSCVTQFCPKGVSDTECYCYNSTGRNIAICIPNRCDTAAVNQADNLWNQFCTPTVESWRVLTRVFLGGFIPSASANGSTTTKSGNSR